MDHTSAPGLHPVAYRCPPVLERIDTPAIHWSGITGERIDACLHHWWLTAPNANPAMLRIFRDRDRRPPRDLVPWAGEFAGKYLTSAVLGWLLTRDEQLEHAITRVVAELAAVQDADGYLGPFPHAQRLVGRDSMDWHALWDVWGHYHCLLGLLLWYRASGSTQALQICCKIGDLMCRTFLDGPHHIGDAGAEEMNMAIIHGLCLLYQVTGEARYLALAHRIEAAWEQPPAGDYLRQALAGVPFYQMPKPRWESLHNIQALAELYLLTGEARYCRAFEQIWYSIAALDRHTTGGFSAGEQAVGNPYDPRAIETCCTVAWMALSIDMLRLTGRSRVADELELATFNGLLGGQSPSGRWWTYNTPMDGVKRASAHDIVFQARAGSPELNCCAVNGPRGLGMLAEWGVMQQDGNPVLNFYGPVSLTCRLKGGQRLTLDQETTYPRDGSIRMRLGLDAPVCFPLRLRIPGWSQATRVWLNDQPLEPPPAGSYLRLERCWADGDWIELQLDMRLHYWLGERECAGKAAIYRGPLLLAYDQQYNAIEPDGLQPLDLQAVHARLLEPDGVTPAWLLVRIEAANRQDLTLCDFATAGMAGTQYRTWLPATNTHPRSGSRVDPSWARSVPVEGETANLERATPAGAAAASGESEAEEEE